MKRILLFILDAITLYLSFYVSYLILDLVGMTVTDAIITIAYVPVAVKIGVYFIFFMYSMNRQRSYLIDIFGIVAANIIAVVAVSYLYEVSISDNLVYFAIVAGFDLLISLMIRYLFRTSKDEYDYDDEEDQDYKIDLSSNEDETEISVIPEDETENDPFQQTFYDHAYIPEQIPITQQIPVTQQIQPNFEMEQIKEELERMQREKDEKIDRLIEELNAKEERIQILENKIALQSSMAYDNYSHTETYINDNKKEILDKILDDVKSLYSNLNNRSRVVEDREYNILLKMVELEEKERALDEIQSITRYSAGVASHKKRKRTSGSPFHRTFSDVYNLPKDNPELAKNIVRTIDSLHTSKPSPSITLTKAPIDPKQTAMKVPKKKIVKDPIPEPIKQRKREFEEPTEKIVSAHREDKIPYEEVAVRKVENHDRQEKMPEDDVMVNTSGNFRTIGEKAASYNKKNVQDSEPTQSEIAFVSQVSPEAEKHEEIVEPELPQDQIKEDMQSNDPEMEEIEAVEEHRIDMYETNTSIDEPIRPMEEDAIPYSFDDETVDEIVDSQEDEMIEEEKTVTETQTPEHITAMIEKEELDAEPKHAQFNEAEQELVTETDILSTQTNKDESSLDQEEINVTEKANEMMRQVLEQQKEVERMKAQLAKKQSEKVIDRVTETTHQQTTTQATEMLKQETEKKPNTDLPEKVSIPIKDETTQEKESMIAKKVVRDVKQPEFKAAKAEDQQLKENIPVQEENIRPLTEHQQPPRFVPKTETKIADTSYQKQEANLKVVPKKVTPIIQNDVKSENKPSFSAPKTRKTKPEQIRSQSAPPKIEIQEPTPKFTPKPESTPILKQREEQQRVQFRPQEKAAPKAVQQTPKPVEQRPKQPIVPTDNNRAKEAKAQTKPPVQPMKKTVQTKPIPKKPVMADPVSKPKTKPSSKNAVDFSKLKRKDTEMDINTGDLSELSSLLDQL